MSVFLRSAGLAAMSLFAMLAVADEVGPGSKAPPLEIKSWVKGKPIKELDPRKLYVVEFWATWCGPCKESIPHLTEIAHKNKDVIFIGVSIWEDEKDGNIQKFVADMGDKMDYNVAYSGNMEGTAKSWMSAASQNGIPTAFVIKEGKIAWVGHPMELEKPLGEIKAGKFDAAAFKVKFDKSATANREMIAANEDLTACIKAYEAGKTDEAKKMLEAAVTKHPTMANSAKSIRFGWLAKEDPKAWELAATKMAESKGKENILSLCSFGYHSLSDPKGNVEQGRRALALALDATKGMDFDVLQYATAAYKAAKDYKSALDMVNKSIEILWSTEYANQPKVKEGLEKQKADLEAKLKGQ